MHKSRMFRILAVLFPLIEATFCEDYATTSYGIPLVDKASSLTVGPYGPMLLEDVEFIDDIAHFVREKIPERPVHAKGQGAFGYFEVTDDITQYTAARVFSKNGNKTRVAARFSLAFGSKGQADTTINVRGLALKFYTEEGIWDLVTVNVPVFLFRDPSFTASFMHVIGKHPVTGCADFSPLFDLITLRPEHVNAMLYFFSDIGIPDGYRYMDTFSINEFKLVNASGDIIYCKFILRSDQGIRNLNSTVAASLTLSDPDYASRDLYNAIASGDYPSWTLYIQLMTVEEAANSTFHPFDPTKLWPEEDYPLRRVGRIVLNRNPENQFADVEQMAFSPGHLVPGILPSPDRTLIGRLFAYPDAHRYRIGANSAQLPVNRPRNRVRNFQRDGTMAYYNQGNATNYYPNSFGGPNGSARARRLNPPYFLSGEVGRYDLYDDDNFSQATVYYRSLTSDEQERLISRIVDFVGPLSTDLQERVVNLLSNVDETLGEELASALGL